MGHLVDNSCVVYDGFFCFGSKKYIGVYDTFTSSSIVVLRGVNYDEMLCTLVV